MKYRHKTLSQTQLGLLFGVSSHEVGRWLVVIGLREAKGGKPSREAHRGNYCETVPSGPSGYFWAWNAERVVARLQEAGHQLLPELPEELVEPPALNGPFRVSETCPKEIINADGTLAIRASCRKNAEIVMRILELAYQRGVINRLAGRDKSGPQE